MKAISCFSLAPSESSDLSSVTGTSEDHTRVTVSPPSYSVRETHDGRFFNDTLRLNWPARPTDGYYSLKEYYRRRMEMVKIRDTRTTEAFAKSRSRRHSTGSVLDTDFMSEMTNRSPKWFLGQVSPYAAAKAVDSGELAVFYPLTEPDLNDIPLALRPMIVYRSQLGQAYFFELTRNPKTDFWELALPGYRAPQFSRLKQLVYYIRTTGFLDPQSGRMESFPLWRLEEQIMLPGS